MGRQLRLLNLSLRTMRVQDVLYREALRRGPITFVQIGANDGIEADPLHPFINDFAWTGVMVEPQSFVFVERLRPRYRDNPRIQLVNAAIGPETGSMPLYVLSFSDDRWATGKASLDRCVLERAVASGLIERLATEHSAPLPPNRDEWITSIDVPVITVPELLDHAGVTDFDLLHVDTEGSDSMIVRQFDFDQLTTNMVLFEHKHLDAVALVEACSHLAASGFTLRHDRMDVLATRGFAVGKNSLRDLQAPWAIER